MLKMRFKRCGRKRQPMYRIVVMQATSPRDGKAIRELGFYNPRTNETRLDIPSIVNRLNQGAQPSDTVRAILKKEKVFEQTNV